MEHEQNDPVTFRSLSDTQKQVVALLPIPFALLSLIGSSIIIYMAIKSRSNAAKKWTPYNRLVMGMSCFDVLTSIILGMAAFLYPKETSNKAFVIGNETTCTAVGLLQQMNYAVVLYSCSLSIYFLLTTRFGFRNSQISRRIEPFMHIFCFGYPLITAFVGLFIDAYSEPEIGMGCWIKRYPKRCVLHREPSGTEKPCRSGVLGWVLGGWVTVTTQVLLIVNTSMLFLYVRRQEQMAKLQKESESDEPKGKAGLECNEDDMSHLSSLSAISSIRSVPKLNDSSPVTGRSNKDQMQELQWLKLVRSQAVLYAISISCSCGYGSFLRLVESWADSLVEEKELPYKYYPMVLGQCVLYPLQGLFNMMVYIRPKYLSVHAENPEATRFWVLKSVIFGSTTTDATKEQLDTIRNISVTEVKESASLPGSEHEGIISGTSSSIASVSSLTIGNHEEMKEIKERTKRRLEQYQARRIMQGGPSSTSWRGIDESDDLGQSADVLMSPIAKTRQQLKRASQESDAEAEPRPVPEPVGKDKRTGKGRLSGVSAVLMDGSIIVQSDDSAELA